MPAEYTIPLKIRLSRCLLRAGFRLLFRVLSPVRISGLENVPAQGPYLVAINHVSLFEAPLMVSFWPVPLEAAGAADIWQRRGQALLARWWGGIPVHRGEFDRQLLETIFAALRAGRPLLIAPEGGRSHTPGMRQAQVGVAYIADKCGAPVVPVGLVGTTSDYARRAFRGQRPPVEIHIGKALHLPPVPAGGAERRAALQANTDLVMGEIAALLPAEYRGVYG